MFLCEETHSVSWHDYSKYATMTLWTATRNTLMKIEFQQPVMQSLSKNLMKKVK